MNQRFMTRLKSGESYPEIIERGRVQAWANNGERHPLQRLADFPDATHFVVDDMDVVEGFPSLSAARVWLDQAKRGALVTPDRPRTTLPSVGYFEVAGSRTLVYSADDDLLLNLDGAYTATELTEFLSREFPDGLVASE